MSIVIDLPSVMIGLIFSSLVFLLIKKIFHTDHRDPRQAEKKEWDRVASFLANSKAKEQNTLRLPTELLKKLDDLKLAMEEAETNRQHDRRLVMLAQDYKNTLNDYELQQTRSINELRLRRTFEERWLGAQKQLAQEQKSHDQTRQRLKQLRRYIGKQARRRSKRPVSIG